MRADSDHQNDEKRPLLHFLPPEDTTATAASSDAENGETDKAKQHQRQLQHYHSMVMQHQHAPLLLMQQHRIQQERLFILQQERQHQQLRRIVLSVCTALLVAAVLCWPLVLSSSTTMSRDDFPFWRIRNERQGQEEEKTSAKLRSQTTIHVQHSTSTVSNQEKIGKASKHLNKDSSQSNPIPPANQVATSGIATPSDGGTSSHTMKPKISAFPSFLDFNNDPIEVSYNAQALELNSTSVLLLGGSMHPTRAGSKASWEYALDEAAHNGLNLITIYVFWGAHQPFANSTLDWTLPFSRELLPPQRAHGGDQWDLADAITSCAARGLFVHIRLGPYVCAEYSMGGIPEWIPAVYPNIRMRRMDPDWLRLMEDFVKSATLYLTDHQLWAHQGGPIIMAQVENELGEEDTGFMKAANNNDDENETRETRGTSEIQDYADWCGDLVQRVAPKQIVWTMCNGLVADNTILTYNGDWTSVSWLHEQHQRGRVQVDQPAMWTEDEQGFQIWGERPDRPTDYFWGMAARDVSKNALRWIARQGLHLNYYMWWGGYNRDRTAGAGIMNAYASDAVLCPSGERRQPKFGHLGGMHQVLTSIAHLLTAPLESLPVIPKPVEVLNATDGTWGIVGDTNVAFTYSHVSRGPHTKPEREDASVPREAIFVENNGEDTVVVRLPTSTNESNKIVFTMNPFSVMVLVDGIVVFGSATIGPEISGFARTTQTNYVSLLDWDSWREDSKINCDASKARSTIAPRPSEQTELHTSKRVWSDYSWYTTSFELNESMVGDSGEESMTLSVETDKAMGLLVYIDGVYQGSAENHEHSEGAITLQIPIPRPLAAGTHELSILSESLGYHNLVGRWGGRLGLKPKGIVGDVVLQSKKQPVSLVDKTLWCSMAGLQGESTGLPYAGSWDSAEDLSSDGSVWTRTFFDTPMFDRSEQRLFLEITKGRGHVWFNGHDLGRYWNITRSDLPASFIEDGDVELMFVNEDESSATEAYSQRYYHLPQELLATQGNLNELVFFNVFGADGRHDDDSISIKLSWIESSSDNIFEDTIGFDESCLV